MVRKTRKQHHTKKYSGIMTIPELRRSFEHIEDFLTKELNSKASKGEIVTHLQKEWEDVFFKPLNRKAAEAYVEHVMTYKSRRLTRKSGKKHGGAEPLAGAPLDYNTRPGLYIQPAAIPPNAYGNILDYVSKGFWNPEQAHSYDPVPGQTHYVTSVPKGMGENTFIKGGSKKTRKLRRTGGNLAQIGATLSQVSHVPGSVPPSNLQNLQSMWQGKNVGPSPDQIQREPQYMLGNRLPQPVNIKV